MHNTNKYPEVGILFKTLFVIFSGWWVLGVYVDLWSHLHIANIDTFFTPWHFILYSGFFLVGCLYSITGLRNCLNGYSWKRCMPKEYMPGFIGLIGFGVGGVGDAIWHTLVGFEIDLAATVSPPHIILILSGISVVLPMILLILGKRTESKTPPFMLVTVATYLLLIFTHYMDVFQPFANPWMVLSFVSKHQVSPQLAEVLGFANFLVYTFLFMWVILMLIRYWRPPFGTFTVLMGVSITGILCAYTAYYQFIASAFIAGLLFDLSFLMIKRYWPTEVVGVRLFSFIAPVILFVVLLVTIVLTEVNTWNASLWGGAILFSGLFGLMMSYLMYPPGLKERQ